MRGSRSRLAWLALAVALCCTGCDSDSADTPDPGPPKPLKVMTFNVLCSFCDTANYDPWDERLAYFGDIFARHDPDLMGLQELTPLGDEVNQILEQAPGHLALYFAPDGELPYPDATILYRVSRFEPVSSGQYWLSPTPDNPRSTGFAPPQLARLVQWAVLRDIERGREIYFATTHFDNNSPSQELSAPLVLERTNLAAEGRPVLVVGDFNSKPDSNAFQSLTGDTSHGFALTDTQPLANDWSSTTNQDPAPSYDLAERIDHIFVAGVDVKWSANSWVSDLYVYGQNQRYPSDHFAISAELDYR